MYKLKETKDETLNNFEVNYQYAFRVQGTKMFKYKENPLVPSLYLKANLYIFSRTRNILSSL